VLCFSIEQERIKIKNMVKKIILTGLILAILMIFQGVVFGQGVREDSMVSFQEGTVYSTAYLNILPNYPEGGVSLDAFLKENFNFPEGFKKKKYKGKVYISFIIEKDGSITDVEVLQGIIGEIDREAVRVMEMMPNWSIGYIDNKPVRTRITYPMKIDF